ncbi:hypothetical protein [Absidia glauca]|uniref:PHD-type domain-containing protein n=1 Tax=Absidia glauca TaxID=4829 RepID=A0A168P0Z6_ABSGL|nr:hypothetical protein [Absidia glauca]
MAPDLSFSPYFLGSLFRSTGRKTPKAKANLTIENLNARNHDLCDACNSPGQFLCCEGCPNAFHFGCVEPPMEYNEVNELEGEWFCNECLYRKKKKTSSSSSTVQQPLSFFESLTQDLERHNPLAFLLPEDIRTYFEGGRFPLVNVWKKIIMLETLANLHSTLRNDRDGLAEEEDYHRLKDDNGDYIFCYWCYRTALRKPMISCDFCSLHWHLDCLDPPLTIPPNVNKKWKCPCHTHRNDRYRTPRRLAEAVNATPATFSNDVPLFAPDEYLNDPKIPPQHNDGRPPAAIGSNDNNRLERPSDSTDPRVLFLRPQIIETNFMDSSLRLLSKEDRKSKRSSGGN